ncbi:Uncharacterised protein [Legionella lansingensis]|uniref:Uncharacterized protein n=1 Tax=Legionella lansingensis TaxID=45067 RepID=A0A0W0VJG1_9GAMM|nr:hypothetical protein [Legionella lansingensis]KTD20247.1 hypothetical protein Llan_1951 [Legionella lansingensis]SNV55340.1 Uncharacterised protein [Legionella lansingensis]
MVGCKKFLEGIKTINFSEESVVVRNTLIALAYQELKKEQNKKEQKETNDAIVRQMTALRTETDIDLDAPISIAEPANFVRTFAKHFSNLGQLADILSDAPAAIKQLQTQLYIEVMAQLGDEEQEAQLKTLSFANIIDLIEQAILAYEVTPTAPLHHQCLELIRRACEIANTSHPDHYNEYLDFLFSLTSKFPTSSIIDKIISKDIEEILIDVHKQATKKNPQAQRKLTTAEQDVLFAEMLKDVEQEIPNSMQEYEAGKKQQTQTASHSHTGSSSVQTEDSPAPVQPNVADGEEFEYQVVRALVDLKPLKEPTLFEDDHIIREEMKRHSDELLSSFSEKSDHEVESVVSTEKTSSSNQTTSELDEWLNSLVDETVEPEVTDFDNTDLDDPFTIEERQASDTEFEVLREFLAVFDLQIEDLVNDETGKLLGYLQEILSLLSKQEDSEVATYPSWMLDELEEFDEPQILDHVVSIDELDVLNSLTDEEREILFPQGQFDDLFDKLLLDKPDLEINLKNVDQENVKKLLQFFDSQENLGIRVWKKDQVYTFDDGTKFTFKNDVFQRDRKDGHEGVRYEAISNKAPLGEGAFGQVKRIKGTITLDLEQEVIKFKKQKKMAKGA